MKFSEGIIGALLVAITFMQFTNQNELRTTQELIVQHSAAAQSYGVPASNMYSPISQPGSMQSLPVATVHPREVPSQIRPVSLQLEDFGIDPIEETKTERLLDDIAKLNADAIDRRFKKIEDELAILKSRLDSELLKSSAPTPAVASTSTPVYSQPVYASSVYSSPVYSQPIYQSQPMYSSGATYGSYGSSSPVVYSSSPTYASSPGYSTTYASSTYSAAAPVSYGSTGSSAGSSRPLFGSRIFGRRNAPAASSGQCRIVNGQMMCN